MQASVPPSSQPNSQSMLLMTDPWKAGRSLPVADGKWFCEALWREVGRPVWKHPRQAEGRRWQ